MYIYIYICIIIYRERKMGDKSVHLVKGISQIHGINMDQRGSSAASVLAPRVADSASPVTSSSSTEDASSPSRGRSYAIAIL